MIKEMAQNHFVIKAGKSNNPSKRKYANGAHLIWQTTGDREEELGLFWCAAQYQKLSVSLGSAFRGNAGYTEMYGDFNKYEDAVTEINRIAKRYLTDFA